MCVGQDETAHYMSIFFLALFNQHMPMTPWCEGYFSLTSMFEKVVSGQNT